MSCCNSSMTSCASSPRQRWPMKPLATPRNPPPSFTKPGCGWGGNDAPSFQNRAHFFGAAAEAMRILIERAQRRIAAKRGAGAAKDDLDEIEISSPVADDDQLLAVNEALEKSAVLDPRKAALVKLRYVVGMSFDEAATRWASPCPQPDSGEPTPAPGSRSNARWDVAMKRRRSALLALRQVRIPSGVGESCSGGRIGNADEVLAAGTLNLPARELSLALERLFAVRTIEFEFSCAQKLQPYSCAASGKGR